jgi:hypothetical protein
MPTSTSGASNFEPGSRDDAGLKPYAHRSSLLDSFPRKAMS